MQQLDVCNQYVSLKACLLQKFFKEVFTEFQADGNYKHQLSLLAKRDRPVSSLAFLKP